LPSIVLNLRFARNDIIFELEFEYPFCNCIRKRTWPLHAIEMDFGKLLEHEDKHKVKSSTLVSSFNFHFSEKQLLAVLLIVCLICPLNKEMFQKEKEVLSNSLSI